MSMEEKKSNPFYHRVAWKRAREEALRRDRYMCVDCMRRLEDGYGIRPRRATMVHHLVPVEERPDLALRLDNLVSLCDECHNRRHPEKNRKMNEGKYGKGEAARTPRMRVIRV
jgi:5-methylcytosine-specific restriction endonuclease McrA